MSDGFSIQPGRLLQLGETLTVSGRGRLRLCRGLAGGFAEIAATTLSAGAPWQFTPAEPGMYLLELVAAGGETLRRPVAIVSAGWAVAQITVGTFTAEDFAATIHGAGLSADYYVNGSGRDFSWRDPRWRRYEREFGDAIYPHLMANDFGWLDAEFARADSNYDTLTVPEIERRLRALQDWWAAQGYAPLAGLASYTPCNELVRALRARGLRILHSVVPEQNWSDGDWAINHWGMPTCPFWVADDDFRKAGARAADSVLAITMNHYHVLLPHLTHWGDFVLSPSHFTRWIRAADSGPESARFREFLRETVSSWSSLSAAPLFFVAGFEFGRTFGTADMTAYNQRGLEELIGLSQTAKLAFATGPDVLAYYDRHCQRHPETLFRQRDHWFGVTVNGKPGAAGDSVVLERQRYKAVVREGELLPYLYYDYATPWRFAARDVHAPRDFAPELWQQINATVSGDELMVSVPAPLGRPVPLAVWDAAADADAGPLAKLPLPVGDDGRRVTVLEIPADWSGEARLKLNPAPPLTVTRREEKFWQLHTFGSGERRHTYLHFAAPLTMETSLTVTLKKRARVDGATGELGELGPGPLTLPFGLLRGWYRFWQCGVDDLEPAAADRDRLAGAVLTDDWPLTVSAHQQTLRQLAAWRLADGERVVYQVFCGANLPLGTRSRAAAWDAVTAPHPTLSAREQGDGVIAFAPGQSFWYHPRGLSVSVTGFPRGLADSQRRWKLLLHSFDPQRLGARYRVALNGKKAGDWPLPVTPDDPGAWFAIPVTVSDLDANGGLRVLLGADQQKLVYWWRERGFIAALHALWVIEENTKGIA
ncbi:MAG: hypothetical protein LBK76_11555 [Verrucomicrobiales bacterium]|nr:hypothetical protein [Verrucomicrobiales bacterium]